MKLSAQTTTQLRETDPTVMAAGIGSEANKVITMTQKFATTCSVESPTKIAIIGTMAKNLETTSVDKMPLMIAMLTTKLATMPSTNMPSMDLSTLPMEMVDNKCEASISANLAETTKAAPIRITPMRL